MRIERSTSSDKRRQYITAEFDAQDVLAAFAEYVERHGYISEKEMRGFKFYWSLVNRYVKGHSLRTHVILKIAQEVDDGNDYTDVDN